MSEQDDAPSADENVVNQCAELLMAARQGHVVGFCAAVFRSNGDINVMAHGEQTMIQRLGALDIVKDGCKMLATQAAIAKAQKPVGWGPGGNA